MVIKTGQDHCLTQLCAAMDTNLMVQFTIHYILKNFFPEKKLGQKYFQELKKNF